MMNQQPHGQEAGGGWGEGASHCCCCCWKATKKKREKKHHSSIGLMFRFLFFCSLVPIHTGTRTGADIGGGSTLSVLVKYLTWLGLQHETTNTHTQRILTILPFLLSTCQWLVFKHTFVKFQYMTIFVVFVSSAIKLETVAPCVSTRKHTEEF